MPITSREVNAVVFLKDGVSTRPHGAGFLVAAREKHISKWPPDKAATYIVTCRHVVDGVQENHVRIRTAGGLADLALEDGPYYHPSGDPADDVAVFPVEFDQPSPREWIPNRLTVPLLLEFGLHPSEREPVSTIWEHGYDVYYVGLLDAVRSMEDLVPMVRAGTIGALDQEVTLETKWGHRYTARRHLIDARTKQGFSGSPCFVQADAVPRLALPHTFDEFREAFEGGGFSRRTETAFFGMLTGFWPADGVATVIPREKILETLEQDALAQLRQKGAPRDA